MKSCVGMAACAQLWNWAAPNVGALPAPWSALPLSWHVAKLQLEPAHLVAAAGGFQLDVS
jgi:hypothetical protein